MACRRRPGRGAAPRRVRALARSSGDRLLDRRDRQRRDALERSPARRARARLTFDAGNGYLPSVLAALRASRRRRRRSSSRKPASRPTASTCTTRGPSSSTTPWPWGGCAAASVLEVAVQDPRQGGAVLRARPEGGRDAAARPQQPMPGVPPVVGDAGRARVHDDQHVSAAGRPQRLRQRVHHHPRQPARPAVGRVVGDRGTRAARGTWATCR